MGISDFVPWRVSSGSLPARRGEQDPFYALQRDFDRLFNELAEISPWMLGERQGSFLPRINVTERDSELVVSAELPGMDENDIELTLTRDTLTIKGEKQQESEEKEANYYRVERSFGTFCRTIPLPQNVIDTEKVEATFKNGVLTVSLPKVDNAQEVSKQIKINVD